MFGWSLNAWASQGPERNSYFITVQKYNNIISQIRTRQTNTQVSCGETWAQIAPSVCIRLVSWRSVVQAQLQTPWYWNQRSRLRSFQSAPSEGVKAPTQLGPSHPRGPIQKYKWAEALGPHFNYPLKWSLKKKELFLSSKNILSQIRTR